MGDADFLAAIHELWVFNMIVWGALLVGFPLAMAVAYWLEDRE